VNRLAWRAFVFAAIGLSACTGSLFQSKVKPPTIYLLSAGAASSAPASTAADGGAPDAPAARPAPAPRPALVAPVNLTVLKPRLRPGLETDRIAVLYPDRHLDYFADARWSGPLGEVIQDLAVQEFRSHANLARVSGDTSVFGSAYWLEIEVADFQAEYTSASTVPTVHVHFLARLGGSGDRRILGEFVANVQRPAAENRLTAIVDAYEHAADAALAQIAALADQTLAKISEAR
jgi:ABC-type uncharacterized transport system auxiliary subunit